MYLKRVSLYFVLLSLTTLLFYFIVSNVLLLFPTTQNDLESKNRTIYIYHDLAHTEIILKSIDIDDTFYKRLQNYIPNLKQGFLGLSYGDKAFMFHTPQWKDISLKTTFNALFLNTPAVIRVGHYQAIKQDSSVIPLKISKTTYHKLQQSILQSFTNTKGHFFSIKNDSYFYYFQAKMPYNMFYTCNTWTGDMLRQANMSISYWTPLAYQVVYGFL